MPHMQLNCVCLVLQISFVNKMFGYRTKYEKSCWFWFYFAIDKDSFKKVGDKVVLSPGSVSDPITSITWKHGPDIAVEWYGGDIVPYRDFRGTYAQDLTSNACKIVAADLKDPG